MYYGEETAQNIDLIISENRSLKEKIDINQINAGITYIQKADRIFFIGTGRSGLALKMAAMRFMHLGYHVFIVGEIVTPAITEGDLLITASGSGTTATVLTSAQKAKKVKAKVLSLTTDLNSPLAKESDQLILIPAAGKTDFSYHVSKQYAGSLFEQFILMLFDGIFMTLWSHSGKTKEDLWPRHANLE
ncbi:MAG: 6-phospho-3-hexuloisomerase [Arachidicoccus sp.]|nr:6-phospho-3-hexuloisomerase [Arachidicoccus sp.]